MLSRFSIIYTFLQFFLFLLHIPINGSGNTLPIIFSDTLAPILSVKIGNQIWMTQNLKVAHFRNGDSVPYAKTAEEWEKAGKEQKPAWCYYNNDPANDSKYGKLYNWYAVNDPRGLAPAGWHIPSDVEWKQLTDFIGGNDAAGKKLKSVSGWELNGNGTNESGFNGLPGGYRYDYGFFNYGGLFAVWWASPVNYTSFAWLYYQAYNFGNAFRYFPTKAFGFSVRCVKSQASA